MLSLRRWGFLLFSLEKLKIPFIPMQVDFQPFSLDSLNKIGRKSGALVGGAPWLWTLEVTASCLEWRGVSFFALSSFGTYQVDSSQHARSPTKKVLLIQKRYIGAPGWPNPLITQLLVLAQFLLRVGRGSPASGSLFSREQVEILSPLPPAPLLHSLPLLLKS